MKTEPEKPRIGWPIHNATPAAPSQDLLDAVKNSVPLLTEDQLNEKLALESALRERGELFLKACWWIFACVVGGYLLFKILNFLG